MLKDKLDELLHWLQVTEARAEQILLTAILTLLELAHSLKTVLHVVWLTVHYVKFLIVLPRIYLQ